MRIGGSQRQKRTQRSKQPRQIIRGSRLGNRRGQFGRPRLEDRLRDLARWGRRQNRSRDRRDPVQCMLHEDRLHRTDGLRAALWIWIWGRAAAAVGAPDDEQDGEELCAAADKEGGAYCCWTGGGRRREGLDGLDGAGWGAAEGWSGEGVVVFGVQRRREAPSFGVKLGFIG